ncbi:sugar phosphate phosphate translocator [Raphidocelis subcapitata]|uniref:Sugar phosphate phosphate translocator n=1 Tax=Raphidocelis subcapitata TaxID=307507 RepID=A0A2V0NR22_9CHLO|nr:sugar phosphate phosphate translocator [Raphidocelis subcapitata]|eukprot:GBF90091.1 sugar phosphate phosphate translocator [Raphidocelis subcapitata]
MFNTRYRTVTSSACLGPSRAGSVAVSALPAATMEREASSSLSRVLMAYVYIAVWIALSSAVILVNKWILDPQLGGFPFPLTLAATHMAFCSALAAGAVKLRLVEAPALPPQVYVRGVLPIGALFAVTLWASNAAYLHLSVSFIQMIKATMPLLVYLVGAAAGAERLERSALANMALVVAGVLVASYGEVRFVVAGVLLQALSLCAEAVRLVMVQLLLQGRGVRLNPITTMYYVAPVCLACLLPAFAVSEARAVLAGPPVPAARLLGSAAAAFALNCSVFLLIGRTSALTMNVGGVVKDWMLIAASVALHGSVVTRLQVAGYGVAIAGVLWYNVSKIRKGQLAAPQSGAASGTPRRASLCSGDSKPAGDSARQQQLIAPPVQQQQKQQQQQQQQPQQQRERPYPSVPPLQFALLQHLLPGPKRARARQVGERSAFGAEAGSGSPAAAERQREPLLQARGEVRLLST